MNKVFLDKYIKDKCYSQNPPLTSSQFIKCCKKYSIRTNYKELEYFEEIGLLFPIFRLERAIVEEEFIVFEDSCGRKKMRPIMHGLKDGEIEVAKRVEKYLSRYSFDIRNHENILKLLELKNIYSCHEREFTPWASFICEEKLYDKEKIVSFYSDFQIVWLRTIKEMLKVEINFSLGELTACTANINSFGGKHIYSESKKDKNWNIFLAQSGFDFEKKIDQLSEIKKEIEPIILFCLLIQHVYYPYSQSGAKSFWVSGSNDEWRQLKSCFNGQEILNFLGISIGFVAKKYKEYSEKSMEFLGGNKGDLLQLYKSLSWSKKKNISGLLASGIYYLQIALMLKRFLQDYCNKDILDVDEMSNISSDKVLDFTYDFYSENIEDRTQKSLRFGLYYDEEEQSNYYYDTYKRLFYLANDYGLDYQPRVTVFVEGKIETKVMPLLFDFAFGVRPEEYGIEFISLDGVSKLLSTSKAVSDLNNIVIDIQKELKQKVLSRGKKKKLGKIAKSLKKKGLVISNWRALLSYNLEKWQITPFFVSDHEGDIKYFLESGKHLEFNGAEYDIPAKWMYLWGESNLNVPFVGNSFELANYSNCEICNAVNTEYSISIKESQVESVRINRQGLKQINEAIDRNKVSINIKLVNNLIDDYRQSGDKSLLERPIFDVLSKIREIALLNHRPAYRKIEKENREYIEKVLKQNIV